MPLYGPSGQAPYQPPGGTAAFGAGAPPPPPYSGPSNPYGSPPPPPGQYQQWPANSQSPPLPGQQGWRQSSAHYQPVPRPQTSSPQPEQHAWGQPPQAQPAQPQLSAYNPNTYGAMPGGPQASGVPPPVPPKAYQTPSANYNSVPPPPPPKTTTQGYENAALQNDQQTWNGNQQQQQQQPQPYSQDVLSQGQQYTQFAQQYPAQPIPQPYGSSSAPPPPSSTQTPGGSYLPPTGPTNPPGYGSVGATPSSVMSPSEQNPAYIPPSLSGQGTAAYMPSNTNPQPGVYVPLPPDIPVWTPPPNTQIAGSTKKFKYTRPAVPSDYQSQAQAQPYGATAPLLYGQAIPQQQQPAPPQQYQQHVGQHQDHGWNVHQQQGVPPAYGQPMQTTAQQVPGVDQNASAQISPQYQVFGASQVQPAQSDAPLPPVQFAQPAPQPSNENYSPDPVSPISHKQTPIYSHGNVAPEAQRTSSVPSAIPSQNAPVLAPTPNVEKPLPSPGAKPTTGASALGLGGPSDWEHFGYAGGEEIDDTEKFGVKAEERPSTPEHSDYRAELPAGPSPPSVSSGYMGRQDRLSGDENWPTPPAPAPLELHRPHSTFQQNASLAQQAYAPTPPPADVKSHQSQPSVASLQSTDMAQVGPAQAIPPHMQQERISRPSSTASEAQRFQKPGTPQPTAFVMDNGGWTAPAQTTTPSQHQIQPPPPSLPAATSEPYMRTESTTGFVMGNEGWVAPAQQPQQPVPPEPQNNFVMDDGRWAAAGNAPAVQNLPEQAGHNHAPTLHTLQPAAIITENSAWGPQAHNAKEQELVQREQQLESRNQQLLAKEQELTRQEQEVMNKLDQAAAKEQKLAKLDEDIAAKHENFAVRQQELVANELEFTTKQESFVAKQQELATREQELTVRQEDIAKKLAEALAKEAEVVRKETEIKAKEEELSTKELELTSKSKEITNLEQALAERESKVKEAGPPQPRDLITDLDPWYVGCLERFLAMLRAESEAPIIEDKIKVFTEFVTNEAGARGLQCSWGPPPPANSNVPETVSNATISPIGSPPRTPEKPRLKRITTAPTHSTDALAMVEEMLEQRYSPGGRPIITRRSTSNFSTHETIAPLGVKRQTPSHQQSIGGSEAFPIMEDTTFTAPYRPYRNSVTASDNSAQSAILTPGSSEDEAAKTSHAPAPLQSQKSSYKPYVPGENAVANRAISPEVRTHSQSVSKQRGPDEFFLEQPLPSSPTGQMKPPPTFSPTAQVFPISNSTTPTNHTAGLVETPPVKVPPAPAVLPSPISVLRSILPSKTPSPPPPHARLSVIKSEITASYPTTFPWIASTVSTYDKSASAIRSKHEAARRKRQEESESHTDELFNANEIAYADIANIEDEFRAQEAELKRREDGEEYERYLKEVFETIYKRLQEEIGKLMEFWMEAGGILQHCVSGRGMLFLSEDGKPNAPATTIEALEVFGLLNHSIEARHTAVAAAIQERDRRYKKIEVSPMYSAGKIAKVKTLEKHFELAEKNTVLKAKEERLIRAREFIRVFEDAVVKGVTEDQDYRGEIVAALEAIIGSDMDDDDGVPQEEELFKMAKDVLALLSANSAALMRSLGEAEKEVVFVDFAARIAKTKASPEGFDPAVVARIEQERKNEVERVEGEVNRRLELVEEDEKGVDELLNSARDKVTSDSGAGAGGVEGDREKEERLKRALEEAKRRNEGR